MVFDLSCLTEGSPLHFITEKAAPERVKHLPKVIYTFRGRVLIANLST